MIQSKQEVFKSSQVNVEKTEIVFKVTSLLLVCDKVVIFLLVQLIAVDFLFQGNSTF